MHHDVTIKSKNHNSLASVQWLALWVRGYAVEISFDFLSLENKSEYGNILK